MGYIVCVRSGDPPVVNLYPVDDQKYLAVIALLEDSPNPDEPTDERVKIVTSMNLRAGPGTTYPIVGVVQVGDEAVVLERLVVAGWLKPWLRLGAIYRAGVNVGTRFPDIRWIYGNGVG